jgi:hypothetical protein
MARERVIDPSIRHGCDSLDGAPWGDFPLEVFRSFPKVPTLEGQYIIKNVVFLSAAIVIGATVRGGQLVADPESERTGPGSPTKGESR